MERLELALHDISLLIAQDKNIEFAAINEAALDMLERYIKSHEYLEKFIKELGNKST